jgi:hypothetical protein
MEPIGTVPQDGIDRYHLELIVPRIPQLTEDTSELLDKTRRQLGRVPDLYAALANGPAALAGYLAMRDHLPEAP